MGVVVDPFHQAGANRVGDQVSGQGAEVLVIAHRMVVNSPLEQRPADPPADQRFQGAHRLAQVADRAQLHHPVHVIRHDNETERAGDAAPVDNMTLHRNIAALFDVDEIDDLAFRLGIPPDEIEGKRRDTRARNLVLYADRRERVDDLVELVRQLRPEWRMQ